MKEDFQKFMELVKTDEVLQKKIEEAVKNYSGEQTEEAVFENVIVPVAKEAGYSVSLDDMKQSVQELNMDEMSQVSGGEVKLGGGEGGYSCLGIGVGLGAGGGPGAGGACFVLGFGAGKVACHFVGATESIQSDKK